MRYEKQRVAVILALIGVVMSVACASLQPVASKPVVSITSPPQGAQVNVGQELLVQANASDTAGIQHLELWVDGALVTTAQAPVPTQTFAGILRWTPSAPGTHTLVVKAISAAGFTSDPSAVAVTVIGTATPTEKASEPPPAPTEAVPQASACVDGSEFVENVTVPDGMDRNAGQVFNKIWRVRNTGTCDWSGYELVFVDGELMAAKSVVPVPDTSPGSTNDLLVEMTAPESAGTFTGQWQLRSPKSGLFGPSLKVKIIVVAAAQPQSTSQSQSQLSPGCPSAPQIGDFIANPSTVAAGQSSVLSWGPVTNATSAVIDQGIGGVGTPGSKTVNPGQTTTYILTATGCGGTVTKQVLVTVTGGGGGNPPAPGANSQPAPGGNTQPWIGSIMPTPTLGGSFMIAGDVSIDIELGAGDVVHVIFTVSPAGSFQGSYNYKLYADGTQVGSANIGLPSSTFDFNTGYKVTGTQTIKATIDAPDLNRQNDEITKTCISSNQGRGSCY
jgi:hypothetical protein